MHRLRQDKAMGMTSTETAWLVAIPESANQLLSHLLFMFEYNVRHGTVIGLVGAGGIGSTSTPTSNSLSTTRSSLCCSWSSWWLW